MVQRDNSRQEWVYEFTELGSNETGWQLDNVQSIVGDGYGEYSREEGRKSQQRQKLKTKGRRCKVTEHTDKQRMGKCSKSSTNVIDRLLETATLSRTM